MVAGLNLSVVPRPPRSRTGQ